MKTATQEFNGTVEVCAHTVSFSYSDFESELTPELERRLEEEAESRARDCISGGTVSGELNCLHVLGENKEEEIRGWWEIESEDVDPDEAEEDAPHRYEVFYGDDFEDFRMGGTPNIAEAYKWLSMLLNGYLRLNQPCEDVWLTDTVNCKSMILMEGGVVVKPALRKWEDND